MKLKPLFSFCFFIICGILQGQTLTPFSKDNLYGVMDADQHVMITPQFTEIKIHPEYGLIAGKQSGAWLFFNLSGKELVKSTFSTYQINSIHGTYVGVEYVPLSHLVEIREKFNGPRYMFNPFATKIESTLWSPEVTFKMEKNWFHDTNPGDIGVGVITREDIKINFMDTTGKLLSPIWYDRGYFMARNFVAIDTGSGRMALYTKEFERRSEFLYDRIVGSYSAGYFSAARKVDNSKTIYCLLDTLGRIVFESAQPIKEVDGQYVILNNVKSGLYTYEGEAKFEFENSFIDYLGSYPTKFKIVQNKKTGIVNLEGKIILEPKYESIHPTSGKYFIVRKGNSEGFLDENMNVLFFHDSIHFSIGNDIPGYFLASKKVHNRNLYGLVDSLGSIVLPFENEAVEYKNNYQFILVYRDTTVGVFDNALNQVFPFRSGKYVFHPSQIEYYFISPDSIWVYNASGKLIMHFANEEHRINAENYDDYLPGLFGKDGEVVFQTAYSQLFSNGFGASKVVIIARAKNLSDPFNHVYNNERKWILPEGYALLEGHTNGRTGTNGMIIVHNIQDVLQKVDVPRAGLIDLNGQWILQPKGQNLRLNRDNQIEVVDPVTKVGKAIKFE